MKDGDLRTAAPSVNSNNKTDITPPLGWPGFRFQGCLQDIHTLAKAFLRKVVDGVVPRK
jgi:hypothetical protein